MYIQKMLRWLLFFWLAAVIFFAFAQPAPQQQIGETSRIFYFHVPCAWVCVLAFFMTAFFSVRYLLKKEITLDAKAVLSAQLGLIFCILATLSGSIWARFAWGAFWNWDPRQTSIFLQLLIYFAYFSLRGSIGETEKRATFSAAYAILAFLTVPFLIFVVPRVTASLHPSDTVVGKEAEFNLGPTVRWIFFASLAGFTFLYYQLYRLGARIKVAELGRKETP
ncbi:MAG: cytochrome c biogenesis protein [candidate division Zixibacteria bacterium]|nr:cytochrome c biogenesis protein [candidate division Zixibacteria bacterium]